MRVRDVMSTDVVTTSPETPFPDLVDALITHGISGLPVVDEDGSLVGVVTEADLVSKEAYGGRRRRTIEFLADLVAGGETPWASKAKGRTAATVMSRHVLTARPDEDIRSAARRMVDHGVKRLPVVDGDDQVVGIVTRTDLLRVLHRDDDEIRDEIAAMLADPFRAPDGHAVAVTVSDGVVTFEGTTQYPMDLPVLDAIAWRVPAVVDVRNQATALHHDPEPMPPGTSELTPR